MLERRLLSVLFSDASGEEREIIHRVEQTIVMIFHFVFDRLVRCRRGRCGALFELIRRDGGRCGRMLVSVVVQDDDTFVVVRMLSFLWLRGLLVTVGKGTIALQLIAQISNECVQFVPVVGLIVIVKDEF